MRAPAPVLEQWFPEWRPSFAADVADALEPDAEELTLDPYTLTRLARQLEQSAREGCLNACGALLEALQVEWTRAPAI